jgi:hypothetical protein
MNYDRVKKIFAGQGMPALVVLSMLFLASCSPSAAEPAVKILEQDPVPAGAVTISVDVRNFDLSGTDGKEGAGQIIYYMDASVPTYYSHSAIGLAGAYAVSSQTSHTWEGVTPGEHTFSVQLVDRDSTPLPAPVTDSVTITVGAPAGDPQLSITNLADGDSLPPGNILISAAVSSFLISREDMGVVNRTGEGHFIYYIDEVPPTDAGVPATTDTSVVSTGTEHMWKHMYPKVLTAFPSSS